MSLHGWYTESWTREPYDGRDGQGVPSYGSQETVTARSEKTSELVQEQDGTHRQAKYNLYLQPNDEVDERDRMTPPNDTVGGDTSVIVLEVDKTTTGNGELRMTATLGD